MMSSFGNPVAVPPRYRTQGLARPRSEAKRARIIDAAMAHFAERGFHSARVGDIAAELGIAKGSIFQHFKSKDGLFFEVYKKAVRSFAVYMDAPAEVLSQGFFETLRYWLARTERMLHDNWVPYRIYLIGNYGTDLALRREINRFLAAEDPYGWSAFVDYGIQRGDLRSDLDRELIASILEWTMDRFQDALLTEELDPGLFRKQGSVADKKEARIQQFLDLMQRAIGT